MVSGSTLAIIDSKRIRVARRCNLRAVAPKLGPGERVLFEGHPSWRSIIDFYLKGFIATAVICFLVAIVTEVADERNDSLVVILAVVGVGVTVLVGFVKRVATSYTITNRRLHIKKGIVSRTIQETRLERVQNVNVSQGVFQRLFQIGDVDFDTAAGDDYNFIFAGVAEPQEVVEKVDEATRSLQQPKRPRRPGRRAARLPAASCRQRSDPPRSSAFAARRRLRRPLLRAARRPCPSPPR